MIHLPEGVEPRLMVEDRTGEHAVEVGTILPNERVADSAGGVIFTCRHHDTKTGDCRAYEARPKYMCGAYPYGKPCEHGDRCTWTQGRGGFWPLSFPYTRWSDGAGGLVRRTHLKVVQPGGEPNQQAGLRGAPLYTGVSRAAE